MYEMMEYFIHMLQCNNQKTITLHRIVCPVTMPITMN